MTNIAPRFELDCRGAWVYRLGVSPCGTRVATVDGPINIYDVETNTHVGQLPESDDQANCLMYSPDGKLLVAAGGGDEFEPMNRIRVYDAQTLENLADWVATASRGSNVRMCRFNHDGSRLVSCGVDAQVRLWDTADWHQVARFVGHETNIQDVCLNVDASLIISGGLDGKPRIWDVATQEVAAVFEGGEGRNYAVTINPASTVAVSGCKGRILAWDPKTAEQLAEIDTGDATNYLAFTPDGKTLVAVLWGGPFLVIDSSTWQIVHRIEASNDRTHGHALTPDGRTLVTASTASNKIKIWDIDELSIK